MNQRNWTAGERRKFARNMQENVTARQVGFVGFRFGLLLVPILLMLGLGVAAYASASGHAGVALAAAAPALFVPKNINALRQRKADLRGEASKILAKADEAGGKFSDDEKAKLATMKAEMEQINDFIAATELFLQEERSPNAAIVGDRKPTTNAQGKRVYARLSDQLAFNNLKPTGKSEEMAPFATFGEQLRAVAIAEKSRGRETDPRLLELNAAALGANESVPAEGGFLVIPEYAQELIRKTYDVGLLSGLCTKMPMKSSRLVMHAVDEDSRKDGSRWGGILAYWVSEAGTYTPTKPKFREMQLVANKLIGLCYVTEEQLEDQTALQGYISEAFPDEFAFQIDEAIFAGPGAGAPLGIQNSGALVVVDKDSNQTTKTISTTNILNMWARTPARSRKSLVWLVNVDVEPQLYPLTLGSPSLAQILLFTPPGVNGNQGPYGKMFGRDVIPIEQAATLGTQGDITLADFGQYLLAEKSDGVRADTSIHVAFLTGEMAFRFMTRLDGQPMWKKPLTPYNGSKTLSPFVTLQAR